MVDTIIGILCILIMIVGFGLSFMILINMIKDVYGKGNKK